MKNFFARILSTDEANLDDVRSFGDNLEVIPATDQYPAHLVAHGIISVGNTNEEIRTAINIRETEMEFSTNVGQIPNSVIGGAITERLNHRFDGKFIAFFSEQQDRLDLVYATSKPGEWIDANRFNQELEEHATVRGAVEPILKETFGISNINQGDYSSLVNVAQSIIDAQLDIQHQLNNMNIIDNYVSVSKILPEDTE